MIPSFLCWKKTGFSVMLVENSCFFLKGDSKMHRFGLNIACLAIACLLSGMLFACTTEDDGLIRREAFKALLQKNILEKKGIRFPLLSEEQKRVVGEFADDYALLGALSEDKALLISFSGLPPLQKKLAATDDPAEKQRLIDEAVANMETIRRQLVAAYKRIRQRKEALTLPEDVESVYEEAFLKVIQAPTDLLVDLIDQSLEAAGAATELNTYLLRHPEAAHYKGTMVVIEQPQAEAEVNRLFKAYRSKSERAVQTVRELNELTW
jgi:hypothetical protein